VDLFTFSNSMCHACLIHVQVKSTHVNSLFLKAKRLLFQIVLDLDASDMCADGRSTYDICKKSFNTRE